MSEFLKVLDTVEALEGHYGTPVPASLAKEIDFISDHYQSFIERSPFVVIATSGPEGLDCSPRGDPPGFCQVYDSKTVLIPDRPGNNRLDSLKNLVRDPRVSLLFLIPGIGETIRINGRARICLDEDLLERFVVKGKLPKAVIAVSVETIYFQCQKALVRSGLWSDDARIERKSLPSTGEILAALSEQIDADEYEKAYPERLKKTLY